MVKCRTCVPNYLGVVCRCTAINNDLMSHIRWTNEMFQIAGWQTLVLDMFVHYWELS